MVVLRQVVGDELRRRRMNQGRTLRDAPRPHACRWLPVRGGARSEGSIQ